MARYFFHTDNGKHFQDEDGTELADLMEARREAVRFMAEMLPDKKHEVWDFGRFAVTVTDANGLVLFVLDLSATEAPAASQAANRPRRDAH